MVYSSQLLDHVNRPRNVGSFNRDDCQVGTGIAEGEICGDIVRLQIRIDPATGLIVAVRLKAYGCGPSIASASLASEWLQDITLESALQMKGDEIASALGLLGSRRHGALLVEQAILAAVIDYQCKTPSGASKANKVAVSGVGQQK